MGESHDPSGVNQAMRDLRDHIAACEPGSLWLAVCDEWLDWLARTPGDPRVVREIRRDLAPGGELFGVEMPDDGGRFDALRGRLWREVRQVPQVTSSWYLDSVERPAPPVARQVTSSWYLDPPAKRARA